MANRTIECGECGESVPYGRLSCPACGALLAAVTRLRPTQSCPRFRATEQARRPPSRTALRATERARRPPSRVGPRARAVPGGRRPVRLRRPSISSIPYRTSWTSPPSSRRPRPGRHSSSLSRLARLRRDTPPSLRRTTSLGTRPYERGSFARTADPPRVPPPGAYLPPSSAASIALTTGVGRPAPSLGGPGVSGSAERDDATVRAALPSLDAARVGELAGWLVAAGSAMAALGFVLPWSVAVIGARGYGGYLDGWGLASPTHVLALAVVLLTLALGSSRRPSRPGCERACSGSRSAACSSG